MDRSTHRKILAQMYGCQDSELLGKFDRMTSQIRSSAIVTLSIEKKIDRPTDIPVMA